jgi:hypothetical protein
MNAVLLLLQLVVATGAAAQCTVLSEIVTAASSASAALSTATVVAVRLHRPYCAEPDATHPLYLENALAAAASGTLPDVCHLHLFLQFHQLSDISPYLSSSFV